MGYVFGPVPSRRLGRSLGVDLVPHKTCSYDCIYCQLGRTTNKTAERNPWVSPDEVLDELKTRLDSKPDYITLSGSGEPTLCTRLDDLIGRIRTVTSTPIAVLTNGSLLWRKDVRGEIAGADLIVPSLDAGDEPMFAAVNRPHPSLRFDQIVEGLALTREACRGQFWLEVFILGGYTADAAEIAKLDRLVKRIRPDRLQLNTVTRPPAENFAIGVDAPRLNELAKRFSMPAELIADFRATHAQADFTTTRDAVLRLLQRRPCSIEDVAEGLGIHRNEAVKHVEELLARQELEMVRSANRIFFRVVSGNKRSKQVGR